MGEQQKYVHGGRSGRTDGRSRSLVIWSVIVTSVLAVGAGIAIVIGVDGWLHAAFSNPADVEIQPFATALERQGGIKLCSNGDAGYGPDNLIPWSTVYYLVQHADGVTDDLRTAAAAEGYPLAPTVFENDPSPKPDEALDADGRLQI